MSSINDQTEFKVVKKALSVLGFRKDAIKVYTVCDVIVTLILIFEGVVFCRRFCPAPWQRGVHRRRAEIVVEGQESSGNSGKSNLIINNIIRINNFFEVDWMSG